MTRGRGFYYIEQLRETFPYCSDLPDSLPVAYQIPTVTIVESATGFIQQADARLKRIGLSGVVVGVSGGIDSVATAALAALALGPSGVCKVVVDYSLSNHEMDAIRQARESAESIPGPVEVVPIADLVVQYIHPKRRTGNWATDLNVQTRLIQNAIFEFADKHDSWVLSTVDRSERLLARYTEHFYGHAEPLADVYKTEVYEVAKSIGVPGEFVASRPGCETWMWDDELFGAKYGVIDPVLYLLTEAQWTPEKIARTYSIDEPWVQGIAKRIETQAPRISTERLLGFRSRGPAPRS